MPVIVVRILQGIVLLLMCPMAILGLMSGLSGGGVTPAFQIIGERLMVWSIPMAIVAVGLAEVLIRRNGPRIVAIVLCLIPVGVWAWLVVTLQRETGFFY